MSEGTKIWQHAQVREGARIGRNCVVGRNVYVDFDVAVGDSCKLQNGAQVFRQAVLENGVFIGPGLVLNDKTLRAVNPDGSLKGGADWAPEAVLIRRCAAVGAGSVVLPSVESGRWGMVGAGATGTADVPDHALAVGCPARVVDYVCACGSRLPQVGPAQAQERALCAATARHSRRDGLA